MNASMLLDWYREHDVRLDRKGEMLKWSAPKGVVSDAILRAFQENKRDLLRALRPPPIYVPEKTSLEVVRTEVSARWVCGRGLAELPEVIQGLVCERDGWSPGSWADYLVYKAGRCRDLYPDRADKYDYAATLLRKGGN